MIKQKMKVSELIKGSCCGTLLDVPKHELVKMAEDMEAMNKRLLIELMEVKQHRIQFALCFLFMFIMFALF